MYYRSPAQIGFTFLAILQLLADSAVSDGAGDPPVECCSAERKVAAKTPARRSYLF